MERTGKAQMKGWSEQRLRGGSLRGLFWLEKREGVGRISWVPGEKVRGLLGQGLFRGA